MTGDFHPGGVITEPRGSVNSGSGTSPNFGNQVQHAIKNWIQSDLRFCKNEGSKRSKINENGGQLY